jgi:rod shape-determining protein MreC
VSGLRSRALLLGTLAILIVAGLILDELDALGPLEGIVLQLTTPVQRLFRHLVDRAVNANQFLRSRQDLIARNKQLESLVDQLMIENVRLKEFEAQNEDLRAKLNFSETHPEYILKAAQVRGRVIGSEPNNLLAVLIIDVGKRHGIAKGMPVISERGLVGHILAVGTNWSKVLLIIDPSSSVAAMTQTERAPGVVSGRLGQDLQMEYIPQKDRVTIGDVVLTSGMGGRYPPSIVIGQVTEAEQRDVDTFQKATVHPSVSFEKLETVLVLASFEPLDVEGALEGETPVEPIVTTTLTPAAETTPISTPISTTSASPISATRSAP